MTDIAETQCPSCLRKTLKLTVVLKAKPLGTHSLSGNQVKVSAYEVPLVKCESEGCGWRLEGWFADGKAVFDPGSEPVMTTTGRTLDEADRDAWATTGKKGFVADVEEDVEEEERQLDTEYTYRKPRWNDGYLLSRAWCWMRGHQKATLDGYSFCEFCQQALDWETGEALGYAED